VQLLLREGANVNQQDVNGNTPLHIAVISNTMPIVIQLIKGGADLSAGDKSRRTPLDAARSRLELLRMTHPQTQTHTHTHTHTQGEQENGLQVDEEEEEEDATGFKTEVLQMIDLVAEYSRRLGHNALSLQLGEMRVSVSSPSPSSSASASASASTHPNRDVRGLAALDQLAAALDGLSAITLNQ